MQLDGSRRRRLRRLWQGEATNEEIASELGLSCEELAAVAEDLGLPERSHCDVYLPSPLDIRIAAAEIREKWTPAERESRLAAAHSARIKDTGRHYAHNGRSDPKTGAENNRD